MRIKICGLSNASSIQVAAKAGARYVGFVFFEKSPRNVSFAQAAELALDVPLGVAKVALTVNATDEFLDALTEQVPLDMLQMHGQESPARVAEIRARYGLPVMKAVGIAEARDLAGIAEYEAVADQILLDAKPAKGAKLPGGNGHAFNWSMLKGFQWKKPWMLAGGLTLDNVAEAIRISGATQLDLSSGVENAPGVKDPALIKAFIEAAQVVS